MKQFLALLIVFGVAARSASTIEREFTCPLDEHRWTQRVEASGGAEAVRLDSREMGRDVVQPATLPQCPKCRFVVFGDALDDAKVRRLKAFVDSPDYANLAAKSSPHTCLAAIQELLAAPAYHVGFSYLRASWAAEGSDAQCRRLLALARSHFIRALEQMQPAGKDYINLALICGEIERRTELWDEATARFTALRPVIAAGQPKYEAIVTQQLALIERRDSKPHIVGASPDAPPAKVGAPPKPASSAGPKISLRSEPPGDPPPKPKPAPASKVPDLSLPLVASGPEDEPVTVRPLVIKMPRAAAGNDLPTGDPALADTPPPVELQRIPEGLPDAEPLPEPLPIAKPKPKTVKKTRAAPPDDKKNPKPKLKPVP